MKSFACIAVIAASIALVGCRTVGTEMHTDTSLAAFCEQNGFGQQGSEAWEGCLRKYSQGGRGEQFDPRAAGERGGL